MRFFSCTILILLLNTACTGKEKSVEINREDIRGKVSNHVEAAVFDGTDLKTISVSGNRSSVPHGITLNYSGVLYCTRQGYYPQTIIFKAMEESFMMDSVSLKPLINSEVGVLTGVVYKPVTGGKLEGHRGIARLFGNEKVSIVNDDTAREVITDDYGVFMIGLLPGKYDIVFNNKKVSMVLIEKSRTTIRNIQKGVMLID
ncbi:MAG: hypothetical protein C4581_09710 [Nitrospiraceae bacterium]|nr:MAG: hypothetical protein C4581_09710 [Nitrospiraceae bacterium]